MHDAADASLLPPSRSIGGFGQRERRARRGEVVKRKASKGCALCGKVGCIVGGSVIGSKTDLGRSKPIIRRLQYPNGMRAGEAMGGV